MTPGHGLGLNPLTSCKLTAKKKFQPKHNCVYKLRTNKKLKQKNKNKKLHPSFFLNLQE
jgi:hypothetical protein